MVIEDEEVDDEFLERIFQRCHGQPWELSDTRKQCVIRENVAGRSSRPLEKLYQEKEGVTWRLVCGSGGVPIIEPLFAKEKEKNISRAYIYQYVRILWIWDVAGF